MKNNPLPKPRTKKYGAYSFFTSPLKKN